MLIYDPSEVSEDLVLGLTRQEFKGAPKGFSLDVEDWADRLSASQTAGSSASASERPELPAGWNAVNSPVQSATSRPPG